MTKRAVPKDRSSFFYELQEDSEMPFDRQLIQITEEYLKDAFKLEDSKKYFIPEVAKAIYAAGEW